MSLTSHREALTIGAIHHFLRTQGVQKEIGDLTEIVLQRMRQGQCNIRVTYVKGKPAILSDRAGEESPLKRATRLIQ
jgi:2-iminoacetate synthase ThiH